MLKKGDIIFIIATILACVFISVITVKGTGSHEAVVCVSVDGKETARYPLSEDRSVLIEGARGLKVNLRIHENRAEVESADCPDKLCVHQFPVKKEGDSIVCLPARVMITVRDSSDTGGSETDKGENEPDAITY
ncbi:MAG: NusG domain II-containing protein [Lachnospiraceae bacterium]|nr:NusG domain II-containing protein [Lachnospiraceae bacterium]